MRMAAIGVLFVRHSFRTPFKIRDYTNCWGWQLVCVQFCIFCEDSWVHKNLLIFRETFMSGLPYSYPTLIEGAALTLEENKRQTPYPNGRIQEEKGDYLQTWVCCIHYIYHNLPTYCLFYEQQWTRSSFALVQSFAQTFWGSAWTLLHCFGDRK